MIDKEQLIAQAKAVSVDLTDRQAEQLDMYAALLNEWNQKMNLTAIREPREIVTKHFVDSLTLKRVLPSASLRLIDVGTGAGFPGLPLKILCPDLRLTLLDSLNKRLIFLQAVCEKLKLDADLVHARAEEAGRRPEWREQFDLATARAVAPLPVLSEYCLPFVKPGGVFVAMKGPEGETEAEESQKGIQLLGGRLNRIERVELSGDGEKLHRCLIVIQKKETMKPKYPRNSAKIAKQPLK